MPHRLYVPGHEPPSLSDRVLAHSVVFAMSITAVLAGLYITVGALTSLVISITLNEMPVLVQVTVAIPLALGGVITIFSILHYREKDSRLVAMAVERSGVSAMAFGWAAYAIAVWFGGSDRVPPGALIALGLALAFLLYTVALKISEGRIRERAKEIKANGG